MRITARFSMQFEYTLNSSEVLAAQRVFWWRKRWLFSWGYTLFGAVFLLWNLSLLRYGFRPEMLIGLVPAIFALVLVPFVLPWIALRKWRKEHEQGRALVMLCTSPEGIEIANSLSRSMLRWAAFSDVLETPQLWLIAFNSSLLAIPKRALPSEEERRAFEQELLRVPRKKGKRSSSAPISSP